MERALAVTAAGTGEGKTLVALGLVRALHRSGFAVAPFKVGPDYLDARLYEHACGRRARTIDLWLDGIERVRAELSNATRSGAAAVIEGMMGLFDGDEEGETSTAHILAQNTIPALLVVDGWRMSQSAAAIALGCATLDPRVRIAGVVLNRSAGGSHARAVRRACERAGFPLIAELPYDARFVMPERHLGINVDALEGLSSTLDVVADALCEQFDLERYFGHPIVSSETTPVAHNGPRVAYADDAALSFTYPQTLEALRRIAEPVPFSPLHDAALPPGTRAIWLGGGYPECHAERLSQNVSLLAELRDACAAGIPVYAECGGMMLLARTLETAEGSHRMASALAIEVSIAAPRLTIGYRDMSARDANVLDASGDPFRGYEFHYARARSDEAPAYAGQGDPGSRRGNVLASFVHRRFHEGDRTLWRFIESAR